MNHSVEVIFEVPFHDIDMADVAWHGHYYKYFELARTALFRQFNCDVKDLIIMGLVLPVIESHCRYVAPLTYGMRVRAWATLVEKEFRLKVDYLLTEEIGGKRLAKGHTIQVVVCRDDLHMMLPVPHKIARLFPDI